MTAKMEAALGRLEEIRNRLKNTEADNPEFENLMEDAKKQKRIIDNIRDAEELEKQLAAQSDSFAKNDSEKSNFGKPDSYKALAKLIARKPLNQEERALFKNDLLTGEAAANGENYLIPEDVRLKINELRKQYRSAKEIVNVLPTFTLSGSFNYEKDTTKGLVEFDDGAVIDSSDNPGFENKTFSIKHHGALIPISNILIGAEQAALMEYLNRWFVRKATISENTDIFSTLKNGYKLGVPKTIADWKELKKSINKDMDPSVWYDGMITTNQDGFDVLDSAVDENGRPILQPMPGDATRMVFKGIEIKVFSNKMLPSEVGGAPIIYGSTIAGCNFMEYQALQLAYSEHAAFTKNQTMMRVIEGYDVVSTDTSAYTYGLLALA